MTTYSSDPDGPFTPAVATSCTCRPMNVKKATLPCSCSVVISGPNRTYTILFGVGSQSVGSLGFRVSQRIGAPCRSWRCHQTSCAQRGVLKRHARTTNLRFGADSSDQVGLYLPHSNCWLLRSWILSPNYRNGTNIVFMHPPTH